jgi:predicted dehydrogenase
MPATTRRRLLRLAPVAMLSAHAAAKPLSIGFITEPGGTHLDLLVRGVAKCSGIGAVAVADPSGNSFGPVRTSLGQLGSGLRTFSSHREMLEALTPDLVVVTVEARHNPEIVETALAANAHVLCEKPPCIHIAQFESMAAVANSRKRVLMMAMATRANPAARRARKLIELGWIGKIYGVTMNWVGDQTRLTTPAWQKMWVSYKDRAGGGKLAFHGIHYIDLIHYLTGDRMVGVSGFCRNVGGQPIEVEDAAVLALQFGRGAVGTLNTGYYLDRGFSNFIHIWGEKGWIRFDPAAPLRWYSTHPDAPKGEQTVDFPGPDASYDHMMADVVRTAGGGTPFMTTAESLHVTRVVFAGYRASESGRSQNVG